jgi:hypothetical protein
MQWESVDGIHMVQDRDWQQAPVNMIMTFRFHKSWGIN